jgi:hypothetical protein
MKPAYEWDTSELVRELFSRLRRRYVKSAGIRRKPKITEKTIASLHERLFGKNIKEAGVKFETLKNLLKRIPNKRWAQSFQHGAEEAADMAAKPIHDFSKLHPLHADSTYGFLSGKRVAPATSRNPNYVTYDEPLTPWNHAELQKVLGSNLAKVSRPNIEQAPPWIQHLPQKNKDAYAESMRMRLRNNPDGRMPSGFVHKPTWNMSGFHHGTNSIVLGDPVLSGGRRYRPYSSVFHESGHAMQEKAFTDLGITAKYDLEDTAKRQIGNLFYSEGAPMLKLFEEQRANNLGHEILGNYLTGAGIKHKIGRASCRERVSS